MDKHTYDVRVSLKQANTQCTPAQVQNISAEHGLSLHFSRLHISRTCMVFCDTWHRMHNQNVHIHVRDRLFSPFAISRCLSLSLSSTLMQSWLTSEDFDWGCSWCTLYMMGAVQNKSPLLALMNTFCPMDPMKHNRNSHATRSHQTNCGR